MAAGTLVSSGSSLNMPTGSGSERLCRASIHALNNDTQIILSGTAGHIYTIVSVIFADRQGAAGIIAMTVNTGASGIYVLNGTSHASSETFVFNDKFVIEEDDDLDVYNSVTDGDWYLTYIDQDWT